LAMSLATGHAEYLRPIDGPQRAEMMRQLA
jgi:hypothetical protein